MPIINGTFDTDLNGWTYTSGVSWDNGRARIDQSRCSLPSMEQTFTVDGSTLQFDWTTGYVNSAGDTPPSAAYELIVGGVVVESGNLATPKGGGASGTITINTSPYLNQEATLRFFITPCPGCEFDAFCQATLWIDNVIVGTLAIINTTPAGASIIVDGVDTGVTTNATIMVSSGIHQITLSLQCYESITEQINVIPGDIVTIDRTLTKNTGDVSILSTPTDASVYINGVLQTGTTPLNLTCVDEGTYEYVISYPGWQSYRGQYTVVRGITTTIDVSLLPLGPVGTGSLDISSTPPGAEIFLDNADQGVMTPAVINNITVGDHVIRLEKDGYAPVEMTVTITENTTQAIQITLTQPGSLSFVSIPSGAEIFLAPSGQTPVDQGITTPNIIDNLSAGLYDYILRLNGFNDYTGTAEVIPNQITDVPIAELIPSEGCIYFETDPPGALIFIDSIEQTGTTTPSVICGLSLGTHTYELRLEGYQPITGSVDLTTGQGEIISTNLTQIVQAGVGGAGALLMAGLILGAIQMASQ